MADSGEWWLGLSEIACSGDWRELCVLAVPCPGLPSGALVQRLCCSLRGVGRSRHGGQGELCHWVSGGAGLAPGSLQLCRGPQWQCYDCFCTQMVWKASFIVLVLFKNVHNSDVIYKTDCLQDIFCILRCVYCKKKKESMKNDVFLQLSAVTVCLYHCPPTVVPQGSPHRSCDPVKSIGKQVNPCTVLGRRFCALRMGSASLLFILLIYTVITMEMSLGGFFCT